MGSYHLSLIGADALAGFFRTVAKLGESEENKKNEQNTHCTPGSDLPVLFHRLLIVFALFIKVCFFMSLLVVFHRTLSFLDSLFLISND